MAQEVQRILIKYEADIKELRKDLDQVKRGMKGAEKQSTDSAKAITRAFKSVAGAVAAAFTVREVIAFGKELNNLQKEAQGVRQAFNAAFDPGALDRLRTTTRGTLSDLDLMNRALSAREFGIGPDLLAKGLEFARVQANKLDLEFDFLAESFVTGAGRKSIQILDNLGISQADLSAKVKETGDFYEALGAIIDEKLGKDGSASIETLADRQNRLNAQVANLRLELSDALLPVFEDLTREAGKFVALLGRVSDFGFNATSEQIDGLQSRADELTQSLTSEFQQKLESKELSKDDIITQVGERIAFVTDQIDFYKKEASGGATIADDISRILRSGLAGPGVAAAITPITQQPLENIDKARDKVLEFSAELEALKRVYAELGLVDVELPTPTPPDPDELGDAVDVVLTEFAKQYREQVEADSELRRSLSELTAGIFLDTSGLDPVFTEYRRDLLNRFEDLRGDIESFNEEQEDINILGVTPERFNEQLADQQAIYEDFAEEIKFQNQSIALSANRAFVGLLEGVAEATGDSGELAKAFLVFNKLIAIAEIVINLQKEIAGISANPTLTLLPDLGVAAKTTAIAAAKTRAGISIATILATTIPDLAFAEGTSDAPGGTAWVGERGPEIMHVPKGARVFTAEASKNERGLIDAINDGTVNRYLQDTYITPALTGFAKNIAQSAAWQGYDDFALRQAIKGNRVVGLDKRTIRALTNSTRLRHR